MLQRSIAILPNLINSTNVSDTARIHRLCNSPIPPNVTHVSRVVSNPVLFVTLTAHLVTPTTKTRRPCIWPPSVTQCTELGTQLHAPNFLHIYNFGHFNPIPQLPQLPQFPQFLRILPMSSTFPTSATLAHITQFLNFPLR